MNLYKRSFLATALLTTSLAYPQDALAINITPSSDAFALVNSLIVNSPVSIFGGSTPVFSGAFGQAGIYQNPQGTYGLPTAGIVLSSGSVTDYETLPLGTDPEPEGEFGGGDGDEFEDQFNGVEGSRTTDFGMLATPEQNDLLDDITGLPEHFDPAQLDFEFVVNEDVEVVTFFAAFGSEEWPEFIGAGVTDGFGLFVNGVNIAGAVPTGGGTPLAINIDHPDMTDIPDAGDPPGTRFTELDGILAPNGNPVLQFDIPVGSGETDVQLGQVNTFTAILADAGDSVLDTTIYLSSLFAEPVDPVGNTGETEFTPLLPSNPPDPETGEFIIEIPEVPAGTTIWVDPPVTIGYVYEVIGAVAEITSITLPSLATVADLDGYTITDGTTSFFATAGQTIDVLAEFGSFLTSFTLTGIDTSLNLDPSDPEAFPIGLAFTTGGGFELSVTPITPIPLPAGLPLYLGGLVIGGIWLRRKSAAA